jgi:prolyl oligopeptidase
MIRHAAVIAVILAATGVASFLAACASSGGNAAMTSATADASALALNAAIQSGDEHLEWLEEMEGARALAFARAMNERSLPRLQGDPRYQGLYDQALEVLESTDRIPLVAVRDGELWNFWRDGQNIHGLWRRTSMQSYATDAPEWDVVLDLDALAQAEHTNWVWAGSTCLQPDYRHCMLTLSNGGSDAAVRREFDVTEKRFVENGFVIPETKGSVAWIDADTLLIATVLDEAEATTSGYPFVVKRWTRGTPIERAQTVFTGRRDDVGVWPARLQGADGEYYLLAVQRESFFEAIHWLLPEQATAEPIALPLPRKSTLQTLFQGQLIFTLEEDWTPSADGPTYASGSALSLDMASFAKRGELPGIRTLFVPGERQAIDSIGATASHVFMVINDNVVGSLSAFNLAGETWMGRSVEAPDNVSISVVTADYRGELAYVLVSGFLTPETLYRVTPELALEPARSAPAWFDTAGMVVKQRQARSADGTLIPYFIVRRQDAQGPQPTLLYAYGGFQVSLTPAYSGARGRLWLEQGGTYVLANIRGGGEFGPAWHQAGLRTNRQRIFDDMIAVAEALIEDGEAAAAQLGVMGGSNGGLLTGVMYTQRPDLWGAVISQVPLLDMMRFHLLLAGASWQDEYGFPDENAEERAFLRSISPLHNLASEGRYPPMLILTSTKDDRVHPGHARKFAYLLDQLGHEVLYYENIEGGHSAAANLREAARRTALEHVFLLQTLDLHEP